MTPLNQPECDSPRYRDFVCLFGCAYEPFMEPGDFCSGEITPHHIPLVSQGGNDTNIQAALCLKHHSAWHGASALGRAVQRFMLAHGERLRTLYLSKWLMLIEESNLVAPEPKRMQRSRKLPGIRPLEKTANRYDSRTGEFVEAEGAQGEVGLVPREKKL